MVKKQIKKLQKEETQEQETQEHEQEHEQEVTEVKKRAVSTGKKKDWKDEEIENHNNNEDHDNSENHENDDDEPEAVSDPEKEPDDINLKPKKQTVLDTLDLQAIEKLDKEKFAGFTNQELLQVLYVRGLTQQNPTIYYTARKGLLELSFDRPILPRRTAPVGGRPKNFRNNRGGFNQNGPYQNGYRQGESYQNGSRSGGEPYQNGSFSGVSSYQNRAPVNGSGSHPKKFNSRGPRKSE